MKTHGQISSRKSDQQPEDAERAFPFLAVHGFHVGLNELECPGQGHADAAEEVRKPGLRRVAERIVERRASHEGFEDGPELDLLFDAPERVRALLQAFGYRQVPGLDDVAEGGLRGGLPHQQQVINRVVDEIEIALDIVPVDADATRSAEEALELGKPHHWHGCLLCLFTSRHPLAGPYAGRVLSKASRMAIAPSPTAAATRLAEPLRTSPTAKTPGLLVSSGNGPVPSAPSAAAAAPAPVRTNPRSSRSTRPPSQSVHGTAPMKMKSARAGRRRRVPVRLLTTVTASSAWSPCSSRTSLSAMTWTFGSRVTWSLR